MEPSKDHRQKLEMGNNDVHRRGVGSEWMGGILLREELSRIPGVVRIPKPRIPGWSEIHAVRNGLFVWLYAQDSSVAAMPRMRRWLRQLHASGSKRSTLSASRQSWTGAPNSLVGIDG